MPVEWVEKTIDLSLDITSDAEGLIRLRKKTPYLVEPIEYFARTGKHKMTVQAVEQTAKSTLWKMGAAWRQKFMPGPAGIIYQNKDVGTGVIRDSFIPLLKSDAEFNGVLSKQNNAAMKRIRTPEGVFYLMTGDSAIISFPMSMIVGDEINKWRMEKANRNKRKFTSDTDYQVSKIKDMDKRLRTFENSIRVLVCSPEGKKAPITVEYKKSSQGIFHNRCINCGKLTFDTTLPEEYFKYDKKDSGLVDPDTIRLVCPECGFEHIEDKHKINITRNGDFIHQFPELYDLHAGFDWGALAAQFAGVDWFTICQSIEEANKSNSYENQAFLYNSIKGVDFSPNVITGDKLDIIRTHHVRELPQKVIDSFEAVYMGVDTQEVGYWWSIEAIDSRDNWYTFDYGFAWDDQAVLDAWNNKYFGLQPMAGIIDEGGHRKPDVDDLLDKLGSGFYKYKGEGANHKGNFRISENDDFLILGRARYYQAKLLYMIYSQNIKENNFWYIAAPELKKTYIYQMASVQPPPGKPDEDYEFWTPGERQHDLFDAKKMTLTLHDFALIHFPGSFWRKAANPKLAGPEIVVKKPSRPVGGYSSN